MEFPRIAAASADNFYMAMSDRSFHSRGPLEDKTVKMCTRALWVWFAALAVVGGCATYQDRPLSGTKTLDEFEARTLDGQDLQAYLQQTLHVQQWPLATWNSAQLTLAAFFYSPELDGARARWAVAKGRKIAAAERPNPSLSVSPGFNSTTGYDAPISPWIVGAALDIPIETAGKRGYRIAEAQHLSEAARLQIAETAWQLRHQIREVLLDLYAATETAGLLRSRSTIQEDNVKLLEGIFKAGEISANELSQALILRDETRLAMLDAEKQRAQARARLAGVIGVPAKALESKELSFGTFETLPADVPPAEAQYQALLNRPDLLAALAEYQASQSALQLEIARQYPDVQIGPGYEFDQSENKWLLGLAVTLPVLNRNQGAIAAAEANRAEAEARVRVLQAQIVSELEQALRNYRASLGKVQAAETLVEEHKVTADRIRKMYELGQVVRLEAAAAALEVNAGALNRLNARVEAFRGLEQIESAMHVAADLPDWSRQIRFEREDQDHE
jgi:cobalt-zinc-cadmium efflux system outer membrane protein